MAQSSDTTGYGQTTTDDVLSVSPEELPKHCLINSKKHSSALHQIARERAPSGQLGRLRPPCPQGDIEGDAVNGTEYGGEWRIANLRRRLPFEKFRLCGNRYCFGSFEVEDE